MTTGVDLLFQIAIIMIVSVVIMVYGAFIVLGIASLVHHVGTSNQSKTIGNKHDL